MKITKLLILACALLLNTVFAQEDSVNDGKQTAKKSYLEIPRIEEISITAAMTDKQYDLYVKFLKGIQKIG